MTLGDTLKRLKHLSSLLSVEDLHELGMKEILLFKEILRTIDKIEIPELVGHGTNDSYTSVQN